MIIHSFIHCIL